MDDKYDMISYIHFDSFQLENVPTYLDPGFYGKRAMEYV
jgi:hypothetical protein